MASLTSDLSAFLNGLVGGAVWALRLLLGMLAWLWKNGQIIGALATALGVWFAYRVFRLHQTPIVMADQFKLSGTLRDDHNLESLRNSGQGPAFNVCIHQHGQSDAFEFSWLGSLAAGQARDLERRVVIKGVEDYPHVIWYQDAQRRWYATRLAVQGYGLASVWEGRRFLFLVPKVVRHNAKAETVVQFYKRLARRSSIARWFTRSK